jgi:hypothetical protein
MTPRATAATPAAPSRAPAAEQTKAVRFSYLTPRAASPRDGGLSTGALTPSVRKLPVLAMGLVALAIVLLALGALPAGAARNPLAASLLAFPRRDLAFGGLAILTASVAAYLLM